MKERGRLKLVELKFKSGWSRKREISWSSLGDVREEREKRRREERDCRFLECWKRRETMEMEVEDR